MLGYADDEAVEPGLQPDLAAQPAVGAQIEREIEHILFHRRRATRLFLPCLVDIDVAGRATACAPALAYDTRHRMLDRRFHHGLAFLALDRMHSSIMFYVSDLYHDTANPLQSGADYS